MNFNKVLTCNNISLAISKLLFAMYFIFIIASCSKKKTFYNENPLFGKKLEQSVRLQKNFTNRFLLDSLTAPIFNQINSVIISGTEYVAYLNEEVATLYINDLSNKNIYKQIHLVDPNHKKNFNKKIQGFYYKSEDSIYFIGYNQRVYLANGLGEIINEYGIGNLDKKSIESLVYRGIYCSNTIQPYYYHGNLFLGSVVVGNIKTGKNIPVLFHLNLKNTESVIDSVFFPKVYEGRNFGGLHFSEHAHTLNKDLAVFSFPISHYIKTFNISNRSQSSSFAGSRYINSIKTYNKKVYQDSPSSELGEYFMTNPSYGAVLFDKYRNVYYRFALLPVDKKNADYEASNAPTKRVSVIILNNNLKYIGETLLTSNKYWPNIAYVSAQGLNIQERSLNDATADFSVYRLEMLNRNIQTANVNIH